MGDEDGEPRWGMVRILAHGATGVGGVKRRRRGALPFPPPARARPRLLEEQTHGRSIGAMPAATTTILR